MIKLFGRIRGFFSNKILSTLHLPKKNFVFIEDEKGYHARIETSGYLFGIIPLFEVKRSRDFSWAGFISKTFQETSIGLNQSLGNFAKKFSDKVLLSLKKSIEGRVQKTREKSLTAIKQEYSTLHQDFIAKVIKQSTNEFRKELLEKLKASGGEIFTKQVQQHLASLLLKMKEEYGRAKGSDVVSVTSGDLALPVGTRFFIQKKNVTVYVIEQPPQIRTVTFNWEKRNGNGRRYQLAFPFMVFLVTVVNRNFYSLQVFFRKQPLGTYMDGLLCPSIPNVHDNDFKVCFPAPTSSNGSPVKVVEDAIQNFWGSEFNKDLAAFFNSAQSSFPQMSSLGRWAEESHKNPHFVLDINWQGAGMCVIDVINRIVKEAEGVKQVNQQVDFVSALESYTGKLGDKISQEIQESCFFLVPHISFDDQGMDIATERLKKILSANCNELVRLLSEDIDKTFSSNLIEEKLLSAMQETEAQMTEIVSATEMKMTNIISSERREDVSSLY